jgi:hypothetical protein
MLGAPEHPLDAFIVSKGRSCSENKHWMYRFSKNPPLNVQVGFPKSYLHTAVNKPPTVVETDVNINPSMLKKGLER